jgi:hypothetical protein
MNQLRNLTGIFLLLSCFFFLASSVYAGSAAKKDASAEPMVHLTDPDNMRIEGEKRFHANCGRCHAAPSKFPPRMMTTILRHMRVRATVTNEDQRLILFYMTQ